MSQLNFCEILELSETSRARKLIFGLRVNIIDKANNRRCDVTHYRWWAYIATIRNLYISVLVYVEKRK